MPLNSPGGSTLQWGAERVLLWLAALVVVWLSVVTVVNLMTCFVSGATSPTSTVNFVSGETASSDVISGNSPTDDVITGESLKDTEPCSRQRMIICYSSVGNEFNANFGALVPNLTHIALDRFCRYASHFIYIR